MRFTYIANVRLPTEKAHGLQIMKMSEAFSHAGVHVELLVPRRWNPIKEDPFEFYGVKRNFTIVRLPCIDLLWLPVLKMVWFWAESWSFALSALLLVSFRNGSAVCYTRDIPVTLLLLLARRTVFYELHTIPHTVTVVHSLLWQKAHGVIAISEGVKRELLRRMVPESKILLARDAVDLSQFLVSASQQEARKALCVPPLGKIVLYTGHLYDWKGADLLAKAAPLLSDADVYLVGGTEADIGRYRSLYACANLHIVGWQKPGRIPLWLKAADALILPNSAKERIGAAYTSPLKLFEYMASGTPIIAADVPAIREVLGEMDTVFFEPDNASDLAEKVLRVLREHAEALKRAAFAQQKVHSHTWEKRAKTILNFIAYRSG